MIQSFQSEVLTYRPQLLSYALRLTANAEDAEDLLQDTMFKVIKNKDKFINNVNLKGWLFRIMHNIFVNNVRAKRLEFEDVDLNNYRYEISPTTADEACYLSEITSLINSLSEAEKQTFSMFVSGYQYSEIAQQLNVPLGTIKSRIFNVRRKLTKSLEYHR